MTAPIAKLITILERTPSVLSDLLTGLPEDIANSNEGGETWSAYDVIGHLIHGEKTDWIVRAELILSNSTERHLTSFDRFAQFEASKGKTLGDLLKEFESLRAENLATLKRLNISEQDLIKTAIHPEFGEVTLAQHLSTWAVHDLNHLNQISRIIAKQFKDSVGPWVQYLRILKD